MKTITLQEAHDILTGCAAVIADENALIYPSLARLTGEGTNEFLYLGWEAKRFQNNMRFVEANNREIKVCGSSMFLTDHEGDEIQITVLEPKNLE